MRSGSQWDWSIVNQREFDCSRVLVQSVEIGNHTRDTNAQWLAIASSKHARATISAQRLANANHTVGLTSLLELRYTAMLITNRQNRCCCCSSGLDSGFSKRCLLHSFRQRPVCLPLVSRRWPNVCITNEIDSVCLACLLYCNFCFILGGKHTPVEAQLVQEMGKERMFTTVWLWFARKKRLNVSLHGNESVRSGGQYDSKWCLPCQWHRSQILPGALARSLANVTGGRSLSFYGH